MSNMITPITQIAPRLKKLLLMLSSSQSGEVINAARAIDNTLRGAGCDWHDLADRIDGVPVRAANQFRNWHPMRDYCLRHARLLRSREHQFVAGLGAWRGDLTEKQMAWLTAIYARLR
jgi:hypothetical protein